LMPTHFHLILKQLIDKGISKFMHKLGTGYVNYFNEEQKRTGALFEGRFKSILIENDEYLMHLSRYIHLNCIDLVEPKWKENGIKNWENASEFLRNYKWSSYLDYIGRDNVPSVIDNEFLLGYFDNKKEYSQFVVNWMHDDINYIKDLTLE
ncbi:MAG: transposase, partial [Candidatus Omnitrophica bacterium]|nr:transposase [Candidatus Omnitrophota bacterium]